MPATRNGDCAPFSAIPRSQPAETPGGAVLPLSLRPLASQLFGRTGGTVSLKRALMDILGAAKLAQPSAFAVSG
ncbi:hypothetical protein A7K69_16070 [Parageobacillus thermoglucosidasius]|uniref:Uncharacterized protein n=2 Tax=Parageobacillus thermoglucosidasius TaxID=1426 RepID=A0A1B7KVL8_PARTM|nr:hypothetical protein A7K69_16070 [Parageobacillus thermoglucosidasius]